MGAELVTRKIDSVDSKEVKKQYSEMWEEARDYYGSNPYSGSFATLDRNNICFKYQTFNSKREGEDFIAENSDKWGSPIAVVIKEGNNIPYTLIGGWCAS